MRKNPVHPRACGEYLSTRAMRSLTIGSPPRLRGIHIVAFSFSFVIRFTPAPAGNTPDPPTPLVSVAVHPRACGEYCASVMVVLFRSGSPPRLRGIPRFPPGREGVCRFTPAPAGNTILTDLPYGTTAVHPRACGEYDSSLSLAEILFGSPPRLRGIREGVSLDRQEPRFTPAPAGNTAGPGAASRRCPVHPRACGEYVGTWRGRLGFRGSPPRLRGIPSGSSAPTTRNRFTPAPAGNT